MSTPILATKLFIPPPRPKVVLRPRLIEQLKMSLHRKLTLVSAPAGFGKTTVVSQWVANHERPVAWLSLEEGDNDPTRFLAYFIAALQTLPLSKIDGISTPIGDGVMAMLQSPQPPSLELILTALLNEITTIPNNFILVLDDYHLIDAKSIDNALIFLLQHLPPQMHLVIATREDPQFPLARYRARGKLTELRVADLRFTPSEAASFLNQMMGLSLSAEEITSLENRTEGWIAGLQLAALAVQGQVSTQADQNASRFIKSFTGSHRFVLDYLVEEVLQQQPEHIQTFLLQTSILDRLCGPLCDAILHQGADSPPTIPISGRETLAYLDQVNLFIVPLDNERRWYRYHHLFADLLRQRLQQNQPPLSSPPMGEEEGGLVDKLHKRASIWYEDNGLEIEAFHHATAANDVERAERLIEGKGMPLHFRGAIAPILNWLTSLPTTVLDATPSLWITYASVLLVTGQANRVEQIVQAAEAALQGKDPSDKTRDLVGRVAAIRATLAATQGQVETIIAQSRLALEYLHPKNLPFRTSTAWKLGFAYQLQGDRAAAKQAYTEVISIGQASGNIIFTTLAMIGMGSLQKAENQLHLAAESYRSSLQLFGEQPLPAAGEAYLGLAQVSYEWNDLDAAHRHAEQSIQLARQLENNDRAAARDVFLARLKLAQGDVTGAAALLTKVDQLVRQHNFIQQMPELASVQILTLLQQGNLVTASHLAEKHKLPISQARIHLAQGDSATAVAVLEPFRQQMEENGWQDEQLNAMVLLAVAHYADGERETAVTLLSDALVMADPGGFIRLFVDEGLPMARLLSEASRLGIMPDYIAKLLAAFEAEGHKIKGTSNLPSASSAQPLIEPLSQRELEVLQLVAQGLSNREISERLFLALSSIKGHNRNIYGKLQVQRRTEAVARARELGLL
ncbi:MAG: LuxR family transcriptional regulator [Chloroflexi bacterium]|nr:LuxR family transcriptional regulator [Chloroflexota bacterium]